MCVQCIHLAQDTTQCDCHEHALDPSDSIKGGGFLSQRSYGERLQEFCCSSWSYENSVGFVGYLQVCPVCAKRVLSFKLVTTCPSVCRVFLYLTHACLYLYVWFWNLFRVSYITKLNVEQMDLFVYYSAIYWKYKLHTGSNDTKFENCH
jgi:hypothetical protein